jgi:transposase InsO family protein
MKIAHSSLATLDFDRLVPIDVAARLLEIHPDTLSAKCRERWQYQALAFQSPGPDGGQLKWWIDIAADPRLRSAENRERYTFPALLEFTGKQRDQADQRRQCVERLRAARVDVRGGSMAAAVVRLIDQARRDFPGIRISRSRLYKWDAAYQYPCQLAELIDRRGGDRSSKGDPAAWDAFRDLYLHENGPSIRQCWKEVKRLAREKGWGWGSYSACTAQLDSHIPPEQQAIHRTPATWRQQLSPYIPQNPESWGAGELWIGDHKQLDMVCRWGKGVVRPWLTTWMDWRTRKVVGWALSDNPNSTTILGALRHGLLEPTNLGGPAHVWIDNGRDYDAWLFHGQTKSQRQSKIKPNVDEGRTAGILGKLQIEAHFARPYCPNGKARLERWFRTLESFCKTFDTYTGDGVDTKPERLAEVLASPALVPTFDAVYERIKTHIEGNNSRTDHAIDDLVNNGVPVSPADAYARWAATKRVMADPASLDLLMQHWNRPTTVTRNGVSITVAGKALHYGNTEQALHPFKALKAADRRPVNISFDPHDLRTVRVFDEDFRFICTAAMNQLGGRGPEITRETVAESARQQARYAKSLKHVAEYGLTSTLTSEEHLAAVADQQQTDRQSPADAGPAMRIIRTPLDGQSAELHHQDVRQAVGSESVPFPPVKLALPSLDKLRAAVGRRDQDDDDVIDAPLIDPMKILREQNHEW